MVRPVAPAEIAERLRSDPDSLLLLDVREVDEREIAAIEPSLHIPMGEVMERLADLPKDREIVVYCHMGGRSQMIAAFLEGEGFERVANLTGGIDAWSCEVDPSVPRYS
ncbi:MAG: rhodanese-like domain-containing protein [Thermoplasmata archaeon]